MIYNNITLITLLIISIICILIAVYYFIYYSFDNLNYNSYMSAIDTASFLKKDEDKYVQNLSHLDLYARNAKTSNEYIENIQQLSSSFTSDEIHILNKCSIIADNLLRNIKITDINYVKHINLTHIADIKWIFSKTNSHIYNKSISYENGFPHTRKNIIFLSNNVIENEEDELVKILIHEKIHIYQRNNEQLFKEVIKEMGYIELTDEIIYNNYELIEKIKYKRSNPDINNKIYRNIKTGEVSICIYTSDKPSSITDVTGNMYNEHPYEEIAYELSEYIYKKNKIEKYKNI